MLGALLLISLCACGVVSSSDSTCVNTIAGGYLVGNGASASQFSAASASAAFPDGTLIVSSGNALYATQADGSSVVLVGDPNVAGYAGDVGGAASSSILMTVPVGVQVVPALDVILVADSGNSLIRAVSRRTLSIATAVGTAGLSASGGDGGDATSASLVAPYFVALSPNASVMYIGDRNAGCVRRVRYANASVLAALPFGGGAGGKIDTIVGSCGVTTGAFPSPAPSFPASRALVAHVYGIAVDSSGVLYVADAVSIWAVDTASRRMTVLYNLTSTSAGFAAQLISLVGSLTVREDASGTMVPAGPLLLLPVNSNVYLYILAIALDTAGGYARGEIFIYSGAPNSKSTTGDSGSAYNATSGQITSVAYDSYSENVYLCVYAVIRAVSPSYIMSTPFPGGATGTTGSAAVNPSADGIPATSAIIMSPRGIAIAPNGDLAFSDARGARVRRVDSAGIISTIAGTGVSGYSGDGGPAQNASLTFPYALAYYSNGDLLIATYSGRCVRLVDAVTGIISTVAGTCSSAKVTTGNGGPATSATFAGAYGLAIDEAGSKYYVSDCPGGVVRVVDSSTKIINAFAGTGLLVPTSGTPYTWDTAWEGASALGATLECPINIILNPGASSLFVAVFNFNTVVSIDTATGILTRVFGIPYDSVFSFYSVLPTSPNPPPAVGEPTYSVVGWNYGLSGPAVNISIPGYNSAYTGTPSSSVTGLAFTRSGLLLISAAYDCLIFGLNLSTGMAHVVAGSSLGLCADTGDGGASSLAALNLPRFLAVDANDNIFITEAGSAIVREIAASSSSTPSCPAGSQCPCGQRPVPCLDPAFYCPANTAQPIAAAAGYFTVDFASQQVCPSGSFCVGGIQSHCPPGSTGIYEGQATEGTCELCPAGTYLERSGVTTSTSACHPCPERSSSSAGSAFCHWYGFNVGSNGEACEGAEEGISFAYAGPWGDCFEIPEEGSSTLVDSVGVASSPPIVYLPSEATSVDLQYKVAVPIAVIIAAPCILLYLLFVITEYGACLPAWLAQIAKKRCFIWLRAVDQIGDFKVGSRDMTDPIHFEGSELGGLCSSLAMAFTFSFMSVVIITYLGPENTITQRFTLPSTHFNLLEFTEAPTLTLSSDPAIGSELLTGLAVQIAVQGPDCGNVTAPGSSWSQVLESGEFTHEARALNPLESGAFIHTFHCTECSFSSISKLSLTLPGTCGNPAIRVSAISAQGATTAAAAIADWAESYAKGEFVSAAIVRIIPTISTIQNLIADHAFMYRGYSVTAQAVHTVVTPEQPESLTVTVELPADQYYTGISFESRFFPVDLVYQILATFGFGLFFTFCFVMIMERIKRYELFERLKKKGELDHNLGIRLATFFPGAPVTPKVTMKKKELSPKDMRMSATPPPLQPSASSSSSSSTASIAAGPPQQQALSVKRIELMPMPSTAAAAAAAAAPHSSISSSPQAY